MKRLASLLKQPWLWAWGGALAVWLATAAYTQGQGSGQVLSAALTFGAFFVIVALGQMFVITLGPGNVDLSIPACMTLAGTVSMKAMEGSGAMLPIGLLLALAVGLVVGGVNYTLIRLLRIPPIIATLSSSFIFQSAAIWWNRGLRVKPPTALADFATAKVAGIPVIAIAVILLAACGHVLLTRTVYGRSVVAIGQNMRAAHLAGIKVERVRAATYMMCATLAGLCGFLLAGFSGGAALNMGEEYLLSSIAVVVIGGTSVAGGFANVPGLWGAALFLFLLVTMLNTMGAGAGLRMVLTGLIIIGVIVAASGGKRRT
ncbi:ABC transporter permease [Jannaschia seohaensis]|uniref:Ribose transport system permease protein n=1 Tax=Jannaschia seohaensis TaxID=475081 RepID=A0A2Y9B536_9RHOB|nr:ABC transporter permease [Jannaschia seohaensis]PWJ10501.1 ribose transport system permease protein [Jannaschia seohaensis]SSA51646.1 ribose transport system permease protein [Jannaschia seohaensis]